MAFRRGPAHGLLVSLAAITLASSSDEASPLAKQCEVGSGEGQCERRERCNLERRTGMTPEEFKLEFQDKKPVVMTNVNDNREFARLVTLNALKENFGSNMLCKESIDDADFVEEEDMCTHNILHIRDKNVILSSSNTYSYDKEKMDFGSYLDCVTKNAVKINDRADRTYYMFGDNYEPWLDGLLENYDKVPFGEDHALSFGVGAMMSGVPFHFHGPGFSEVISGRKRWFIYPPGYLPSFEPNRTTIQWLNERYRGSDDNELKECTIHPGEVIHVIKRTRCFSKHTISPSILPFLHPHFSWLQCIVITFLPSSSTAF